MRWTLYILRCADGSLYTGITNDVDARIAAHEAGKGAKYTRGRGPFQMVYTEDFATRSEASSREMHIKRMDRAQKLALLA